MGVTNQSITANAQSRQIALGDDITNVSLHVTGTFTGINLAFEGSLDGGTTWFATDGIRSTGNIVENTTGSLSAAPAYSWDVPVGGYSHFRVRSTAFGSGTQVVYFGCYAAGMDSAPVAALAASSSVIGDVAQQYRASNTGAATIAKISSAATTNATSVKASAGRVIGAQLTNTSAAFKYFRLFNKASAPTVGTDSPVHVIGLPPNSSVSFAFEGGEGFATGIAYAITGAAADLDATAVAALDVLGALVYA